MYTIVYSLDTSTVRVCGAFFYFGHGRLKFQCVGCDDYQSLFFALEFPFFYESLRTKSMPQVVFSYLFMYELADKVGGYLATGNHGRSLIIPVIVSNAAPLMCDIVPAVSLLVP